MIIRARRAPVRPQPPSTIPFTVNPLDREVAPETPRASPDKILEVHEVADRFKKHPETVKRQLRQGKLHGFKFGRSWFVREADVQSFILDALESERHLCRRKEQI
jgi:hypothetical protein